jgi:hypothetical protein
MDTPRASIRASRCATQLVADSASLSLSDRGCYAPVLLFALIHPSAWKAYSPNFACRIPHRAGPAGAGNPPTASWDIPCLSTSCGAGWICTEADKPRPRKDLPACLMYEPPLMLT